MLSGGFGVVCLQTLLLTWSECYGFGPAVHSPDLYFCLASMQAWLVAMPGDRHKHH